MTATQQAEQDEPVRRRLGATPAGRGRTVFQRVAHMVAVLFIVSVGLAFLIELTPGDPAFLILGDTATAAQIDAVHEKLGLNEPILERYWDWISSVATADFGQSYTTNRPVTDTIRAALPVTIELLVLSLSISLVVAVPIGMYTAYRAGRRFDRLWQWLTSGLISFPSFVSALFLVFVFTITIESGPFHFPATGWVPLSDGLGSNLRHAMLPAIALALTEIAQFSRVLRDDMIATLHEDYILSARARGVPTWRILLRHALRPSSFSLVTLAALSMGRLIGGTVIVETLFALPGLGRQLIQAILAKDIPVVQGMVMFVAIAYVALNALVDFLYRMLDPRVRVGGRS